MLTKQIEGAQKKVEQQNFLIRKRVLEYDDVMNEQRRVVYKYRREILEGRDMSEVARAEVCRGAGASRRRVHAEPTSSRNGTRRPSIAGRVDLAARGRSGRSRPADLHARGDLGAALADDILSAYEVRAEEFGPELMGWLERQVLLQIIDNRWREHLYEMDYLREGIHLRGFAQIDPLVAYKNEGFTMFEELMASIWQEFARVIFHVEVNIEPEQRAGDRAPRRASRRT